MSSPVVPEMARESLAPMRIFGFAGWSGSGKTTLIEQIIPRLVQKGLTVSLVKHAHHRTEFDQPGKDSYRLRHAGCSEVLVTSGARWALMHELRGEPELPLAQALQRLSPCDLVLIEGYKAYPIPKLEIWRAAVGKPLLHPRILGSSALPRTARLRCRQGPSTGFPCSRYPMLMRSQHSSPRRLRRAPLAIDFK
jgi:molybdopterin-guanine dinucleotide biosynthesis protein B